MIEYRWINISLLKSKSYTCGYCSQQISSAQGYFSNLYEGEHGTGIIVYIYICHFCGKPTFFDNSNEQTPGPKYGNEVTGIEDDKINKLYEESRKCIGCSAYTSAILACRKLLMHIAVEKGADKNLKFIEYVEYLSEKGYIPPDSKEWVDEIREKGNEATHEIVIMSEADAKDLIRLTEMLLRIIYEFPAEIKKKRANKV